MTSPKGGDLGYTPGTPSNSVHNCASLVLKSPARIVIFFRQAAGDPFHQEEARPPRSLEAVLPAAFGG